MDVILVVLTYALYLAAFLAVCYVPGFIISRFIPGFSVFNIPKNLVRQCLGMVFWIYFIFFLSALGILYHKVIFGAIAVAVIGFIVIVGLDFHKRKFPGVPKFSKPGFFQIILLSSIVAVLFVFFLRTLLPIMSHDAQVYHLNVPKLTIQNHGFQLITFNVYSHWPLNIEQLFTLALVMKDYILAKLVHYSMGVLTIAAIYFFCKEHHSRAAGLIAIVFFLANGVVFLEMPIAYIDIGLAFYFFMSFWLLTKSMIEPESQRSYLLLAGIFMGAMAGCKLNAFWGGACLGLTYLLVKIREKKFGPGLFEIVFLFALPGFALLLPWLIKSALFTGNPVYPLLYKYFGGIEWNENLSEKFFQWHNWMGMGREPLDYLLLPWRLIMKGGKNFSQFGGTLNYHWLFVLPLMVVAVFKRPIARWLVIVGFLYFVIWSTQSQQSRFLIPILPFFSIAGAMGILDLAGMLKSQKAFKAARALLMIMAAVFLVYSSTSEIKKVGLDKGTFAYKLKTNPVKNIFKFINSNVRKDKKILFVKTNRGYFCDREYIADSFYAASQIQELIFEGKTGEEIFDQLKAMDVTHILEGSRKWKIRIPKKLKKILNNPRKAFVQKKTGRFTLYRLIYKKK